MNPYVALAGAIFSEIVATTALNLSEGFSNLGPTVVLLVGYGLSFYLLSLALEQLPVGMIYATWSAIGVVAIAVIGVLFFDEPIDTAAIVGFGLVIAGVYVLNVVSNVSAH